MADPENPAGEVSPDAMTAADEAALHGEPIESAPAPSGEPAPESNPAPQPDAPKEAAPEPKAETKAEDRRVPLADLIEERKARQALKAELDAMRAEIAKLRPPAPDAPKIPNRDEDPVSHFDVRQTKTETELAELKRQHEEQQKAQQRQQRETQVKNWFGAQANQFAATTPEFGQSYRALMDAMVQDHRMAGWDADTSTDLVNQIERAIVEKAIADGANPAERIFAMAKARNLVQQPKGAAPAPEQTADAKIAAIRAGQQAARGVGAGANGANAAQGLTIARLAEMPDEDFAKLTDAEFKRAMLGG